VLRRKASRRAIGVAVAVACFSARPALATPFLYVANFNASSVSVIDTDAGAAVATVAVGLAPFGLAVHPSGTRVYVGIQRPVGIAVLDAARHAVVSHVPMERIPRDLALDPNGTRLYAVGDDGVLWVVDTASEAIIASRPLGDSPAGVTVHPSGDRLYVVNSAYAFSSVWVIDAGDLTLRAPIPVGWLPRRFILHPGGDRGWVTQWYDHSGPVFVIDTTTNALLPTLPSVGIDGAAVSPAGDRLYVVGPDYQGLSVVDTASGRLLRRFSTDDSAPAVAVHPGGRRVYLPHGFPPHVSAYDADSGDVVARIPVGEYPQNLAIGPDVPTCPRPVGDFGADVASLRCRIQLLADALGSADFGTAGAALRRAVARAARHAEAASATGDEHRRRRRLRTALGALRNTHHRSKSLAARRRIGEPTRMPLVWTTESIVADVLALLTTP
jgi:YVTN family beta-propeller protein